MKILRIPGWIVAILMLVMLVVRGAMIAFMVPYLLYMGLRESGYPWWVQMAAGVALIAALAYLWRSGALERPRRRR